MVKYTYYIQQKSEIKWGSIHIYVMGTACEKGFDQREMPHQALGEKTIVFQCCVIPIN